MCLKRLHRTLVNIKWFDKTDTGYFRYLIDSNAKQLSENIFKTNRQIYYPFV